MSNSNQVSSRESASYEDDKFEVEDEEYSYSDDSIPSNESVKDSEITSVTSRTSYSEDSFCMSKHSQLSTQKQTNQNPQSCMRKVSSSPGIINNRNQRKNMSFSNMETMRIERENQYLLRKIMAQQRQKKNIQPEFKLGRPASSAINRKKMQQQIDADNITILKKIQGAKSSSLSGKMLHGRQTSLC